MQYRYVLSILGFFGLFCIYVNRVNINVALVAMVSEPHTSSGKSRSTTGNCPSPVRNSTSEDVGGVRVVDDDELSLRTRQNFTAPAQSIQAS